MQLVYKLVNSPIGLLKLVATDKGLVAILWENDKPRRVRLTDLVLNEDYPMLKKTEEQLKEYFAGNRNTFPSVLTCVELVFKTMYGMTYSPFHSGRREPTVSSQDNLATQGQQEQ